MIIDSLVCCAEQEQTALHNNFGHIIFGGSDRIIDTKHKCNNKRISVGTNAVQ